MNKEPPFLSGFPSSSVTICDLNTSNKKQRQELWKKVSLVFQYPEQQIFQTTVFDEVAYGPRNLGISEMDIKYRVDDALGSLLSGTLFGVGFLMSFSGALAATCFMALFLRLIPSFDLTIVSIMGAIAHNSGQLLMGTLILSFPGIFYYLPVMLIFSVPTGIITGLLVKEMVKYVESASRFDTFFTPMDK